MHHSKNEEDLERSHDMLQRELRALLEMEGQLKNPSDLFSCIIFVLFLCFFFMFFAAKCFDVLLVSVRLPEDR